MTADIIPTGPERQDHVLALLRSQPAEVWGGLGLRGRHAAQWLT